MDFQARIVGTQIVCRLTVDRDLSAPVLCFSGLVPMSVLSGGKKIKGEGGYTEIQLPPLKRHETHIISIFYQGDEFVSLNRAWLPMGPYLRCGETLIPLPSGEQGLRLRPRPLPKGPDLALRLCPQPARFVLGKDVLRVTGVACNHPAILRAHALSQRLNLGGLVSDNGLPLEVDMAPTLPKEGYRLHIDINRIRLQASDEAGLFYGGVSLVTLLKTHENSLPCGVIEDMPRFEWRGQHLDCARHYYDLEFIMRLLDLMALMKLNRFHWHFADDEAFRLELDSLPELARTHFRGESALMPGIFGGGIRQGGSYSRADVQRLIAHAKQLHIEIMPEIEVPAHARSLALLYPKTRDPLDQGQETSVQGYTENVLNPAMPESWQLWKAMAAEMADMFPMGLLHLGGDELPQDTWLKSPAARALMQEQNLETTYDLLGWTMNKLATYLKAQGTRIAAWEEASFGKVGIGHDAILFSWSSQGAGLKAARKGYRVVMTPGQHLYFDMAHTSDQGDWGANWAAFISLDDTIAWDPVPDDEPGLEANILGVQSAYWGEFTTNDKQAEPMVAPRILGTSIMGWQARKSASKDLMKALEAHYDSLFAQMNWSAY